MTETVVELRDVFCVHRTNEGDAAALQGTCLELARGEVLCVLGPSGAGKSTLLRVVAGIQPPSAGIVHVLGCDVGRMRPRARARLRHEQIGFLGQHADTALPPDLRAGQAVALPLALRGAHKRARRARVDELLRAASLEDRADAFPGELSGGERQLFAVCAAVAHRPTLLLADEPTGELDEAGAGAVRSLIAELARGEGTSVIIVSHDAASSEAADRAVHIRDGRVAEDRRHGEHALVIGRDGWLRLPSELLAQSGIGSRARVRAAEGGLLVTPAMTDPRPSRTDAEPSPPEATAPGSSTQTDAAAPARPAQPLCPARVELRAVIRAYEQGRGRQRTIGPITHAFAPGVMTVVTGPSGTGKTTLLRLLAGLDRADSGEVTIDEVSLRDRDAEQLASLRRRRIGYLPQEPAPVRFLSALENVMLVLRIRDWDADAAAERAIVTLGRLGLADRAAQRVHRLSAGEAQRVALARALASARGLLIVDEPTSRLDQTTAGAVAALLATAAAEEGQTVICATHDPVVARYAEHVLELRR